MNKRDRLRQHCIERQRGLCIICGHGVEDDAAVHEAIIKRGDLPKDPRIFEPWNCVVVHNSNPHCTMPHMHFGNTKEFDQRCLEYLVVNYGMAGLAREIRALKMRSLPPRAAYITLYDALGGRTDGSAVGRASERDPWQGEY